MMIVESVFTRTGERNDPSDAYFCHAIGTMPPVLRGSVSTHAHVAAQFGVQETVG